MLKSYFDALQEYAKEEETLKTLHETVLAITVMLRSEEDDEDADSKRDPAAATNPVSAEPTVPSAPPAPPPPEPLSQQFALRATYVVGDVEDDRLTTSYWLALPAGDESDQELDLV